MYVDVYERPKCEENWLGSLMLEADRITPFYNDNSWSGLLWWLAYWWEPLDHGIEATHGRLTPDDRDDYLRALPDWCKTLGFMAEVHEDDPEEEAMPTTKTTIAHTLLDALNAKLATVGSTAVCQATGVALPIIWRFVHGESGLSLTTAAKLCQYLDLELRPKRKAAKEKPATLSQSAAG
jgi:hypothetical protein